MLGHHRCSHQRGPKIGHLHQPQSVIAEKPCNEEPIENKGDRLVRGCKAMRSSPVPKARIGANSVVKILDVYLNVRNDANSHWEIYMQRSKHRGRVGCDKSHCWPHLMPPWWGTSEDCREHYMLQLHIFEDQEERGCSQRENRRKPCIYQTRREQRGQVSYRRAWSLLAGHAA